MTRDTDTPGHNTHLPGGHTAASPHKARPRVPSVSGCEDDRRSENAGPCPCLTPDPRATPARSLPTSGAATLEVP